MPWAGPWWRTVTAQVIGPVTLARRNAGGARGAAPAATPRPARNVSTTVHPSMLALGQLACCAGRRQCMGRARMERVRPCATHVHRSKLLFEMELDEIRYPRSARTTCSMPCAPIMAARCTVSSCRYTQSGWRSAEPCTRAVRVTELPRLVLQHVKIRDFIRQR